MDTGIIVKTLIFAGSAIMVVNIFLYLRFQRYIRQIWKIEGSSRVMVLPITLLVLFLIGYLSVGIFGSPDVIMGGILFGGSIFVLAIFRILRTLAENVHRNEELRIDLQAAEKASQAKTVFLSNMSHDIRTPLNAIIGYANLAGEEDLSEEQLRNYIGKIRISGGHLLDLINDILEMSRIESGKVQIEEQPVDILRVFEDIRTVFADQMESKNLSFALDTSGIEDRYVMCDRVRFSRAVMNLLSNAYKFTPEGGAVSVTFEQEPGNIAADAAANAEHAGEAGDSTGDMPQTSWYILTVRDNGIGMSPEFAERVFDSFERERTSTVSSIQGSGLGMSITRSIIELMGGSIEVETEQGKGTEFTVRVPLRRAEMMPEIEPELHAGVQDCSCADGMRILLAEDVEVNREIATMILTNMGFCVETAVNGSEAADMVAASDPGYYNAVLMDVQMPVMNGYEATRKIRSLDDPALASVPIVAVTANAFAEDIQDALDAGMDGHIAKPIDPDKLKKVLRPIVLEHGGDSK